ncbi:MAG: hypothetical protein K2I06_07005 [Ruminococcus sp.]|nr:hypothetical protein [Ruminococcus sp.]
MKFPELVPYRVCNIPVKIYRTDGLNRDGSPKKMVIFEGKCFFSEKVKQRITAEKQIITLSGEMLFHGDISPDTDVIEGEAELLGGIRRKIYASEKARNPDGTVNYTRLELI